ncbi:MAG: hypothetical protein HQL56_01850 [Magnetococcales bacterium]|nr:hypothetical protein [Magnetococcales bacterium]
MRLSKRSKMSLVQFFLRFNRHEQQILFEKHDIHDVWYSFDVIRESLESASEESITSLLDEMCRTPVSMRRCMDDDIYFERWGDLCRNLELDGYIRRIDEWGHPSGPFIANDPAPAGQEPLEDLLTVEFDESHLNGAEDILGLLSKSAKAYVRGDHNAALVNARIALESTARALADSPTSPDSIKWGSILCDLKRRDMITDEHEKALAGVYGILSKAAHHHMTEQEYARFGRSLACSMIFFLLRVKLKSN